MFASNRKAIIFSLVCLILLASPNFNLQGFQEVEVVKLSEIYRKIIQTSDEVLRYKDIQIVDDITTSENAERPNLFIESLAQKLGRKIPTDSMGIITKVEHLYLDNTSGQNVSFTALNLNVLSIEDGQFRNLNFDSFHVDTVELVSIVVTDTFMIQRSHFIEFYDLENEYNEHHIYSSEYSGYYNMVYTKIHRELHIYDSRFKEGAHIGPHFEGTYTDFLIENSIFEPIDSATPLLLTEVSPDSIIYRTQAAFNVFGELDHITLDGNTFLTTEGYDEQFVYIQGDFDGLSIHDNKFGSQLYIQGKVSNQMDFLGNEVKGNLILSDLILEGKNNEVHWRDLGGFKFAAVTKPAQMFTDPNYGHDLPEEQIDALFRQTSNFAFKTYRGNTDVEFEDEDLFQRLISSYYRIYKVFKDNGQINDANQTYVEMKDVQLRQLKYKYKTYGGLENLIQWKLNQLLKFYTDYGTNPSRAIRISIFVVVVFSIFYFFFPSEWDTKSKKQMVSDYSTFVEKNEHGYFKPFMRLSGGFLVSLVNAMTLSLNSFVTLGFGSIPTSGLARYICILQGFIGWFLLSVFTASLINQVLF